MSLNELINHAVRSIEMANSNSSKLTEEILNIDGMSGYKTRHLYNNLCSIDGLNYLEVGSWKGSSFVSSLFENKVNGVAIDNWSEFNGPKNEFLQNVNRFCKNSSFKFIEKNCFDVTEDEVKSIYGEIDIYLYDGAHDYLSHKMAITHYKKMLSKYSIIIIDDFRDDTIHWAEVKRGTIDGISESNLKVRHSIEIITKQEESGKYEYWNGFGLFVCEKID